MYMSNSGNGATYYDPTAQRAGNADAKAMAEMEAAKKRIQELTEGRAGELAADPYQKSVMDFLQGVTQGNNVPFTNEVQGAMLAQQGRGSADAEAAQMASLRESLGASGGSIYDPSYQSAAREALSQRQGRNLDAAGQMASQAGIANHNARMQGAAGLAQARNAQNAQVNQMGLAGAGYRAMESREVGGGGVPGGGGGFGYYNGRQQAPLDTEFSGVNRIEATPGYTAPGSMIRGGGGTPGVVQGYGAPQQPAAQAPSAPGGTIQPETRDAYMTDAERKAAGSYRRTDIHNGTGPYAPRR